jgi:hypothetical protein
MSTLKRAASVVLLYAVLGFSNAALSEQGTCLGSSRPDETLVAGDLAAVPLSGEQLTKVSSSLIARQAHLLVAGFDVTHDAAPRAVATRENPDGSVAAGCVEFALGSGSGMEKLWTALYQRYGLIKPDQQIPILIVGGDGLTGLAPVALRSMAVTTNVAAGWGIAAIFLCIAVFIGLLIWSDTGFREGA